MATDRDKQKKSKVAVPDGRTVAVEAKTAVVVETAPEQRRTEPYIQATGETEQEAVQAFQQKYAEYLAEPTPVVEAPAPRRRMMGRELAAWMKEERRVARAAARAKAGGNS